MENLLNLQPLKKITMPLDYIILGQGLAGSIMALTLLERGKRIMIINHTDENSPSLVAAGIYNPITGKEMKKTWMADALFPFLEDFYSQWEAKLGRSFFNKKPVYRPFLSVQEQNEWMAKSAEPKYLPYILKAYSSSKYGEYIHDPYGGIALDKCGYLNIPQFIHSCKKYFLALGCYTESIFEESEMRVSTDEVSYKNLKARKIIYCNGFSAHQSKYFSFLPFRPVKGELLLLQFQKKFKPIFNRGIFMLPLPNGLCKIGATYNWKDRSAEPTVSAREELLEKLNKLSDLSFEIKDQIAGIRPATKDRRPFVGIHPKHEPLAIFNGLGTKGVSLAPYFAQTFADFLEGNGELDSEVSINRYF